MAIKKDTRDADLLANATASGIEDIKATAEGIQPLFDADGNKVELASLKDFLKFGLKKTKKPPTTTKTEIKPETKPEVKVEEKPVDQPLQATTAKEANIEAIQRKVKEAVDDPLTTTATKAELYGPGEGPKSDLQIKTEAEAEELVIAAEKAEGTVESGKEAGFNFDTFNSEQDVYKYLEAIELKSAEQTVKDVDTSYRMQMQPRGAEDDAARLDNVTKNLQGENSGYPDDFYGVDGSRLYAPGPRFEGDLYGKANLESYNAIIKVKDNPEATVTIYRAVPNDPNITTINNGDFVTLSRTYAELHGEGGYGRNGDDKGKILSKKVKVKDIFHDGNDVNEFGYFGTNTVKTKPKEQVRDFETVVAEARTGLEAELGLKKDFYAQNQLFTDTQVVEVKRMLETSTLELRDVATKINAGANDTKTLFEFREAAAKHASIVHIFKTGRANVARSLNAFKIPNDFKGSVNEFEEAMLNELGGADSAKVFAKKLMEQNSKEAFHGMVTDGFLTKSKNIFFELYINGLLSSPKSHGRNMFGNAIFQAGAMPELALAAIYSKVETGIAKGINKATGTKYFTAEEGVAFNEVYARVYSSIYSTGKALKAANESFKRPNQVSGSKIELTGPSQDYISSRYLNLNPDKMAGRGIDMLGKGIRFPGSALVWGDEFFKTIAREAEKGEMIARKTNELVKSGITDKDEIAEIILDYLKEPSTIKTIDDAALMFTFQNELGETGQAIQNLQTKSMLVRFYLPFMKTPTNIAKAVYHRTPFTPVLSAMFDETYKKKFMNDSTFRAKEMGKQALGASLIAYALAQFNEGNFIGGLPRDKAQREFLKDHGVQQFSFVIRGDDTPNDLPNFDPYTRLPNGKHTYISIAGLEPVSSFFAVVATAADLMARSDSHMVRGSIAMATYVAVSEYMSNISFLQGMTNFNESVINNATGEQGPQFDKIIGDVASSVIPGRTLFAGLETAVNPSKVDIGYEFSDNLDLEPYRTDADGVALIDEKTGLYIPNLGFGYPKTGSVADSLKGFGSILTVGLNAIGKSFPGGSGSLPMKRDYFGEVQEVGNGYGYGMRTYNFLSPFTISVGEEFTPVEADIFRLGVPGQSYSQQLLGIKMDDKSWSLYQKFAFKDARDSKTGMNFKEAITDLYYSSDYQNFPKDKFDRRIFAGTNDDYRIKQIQQLRKQYSKLGIEMLSLYTEGDGVYPYLEIFNAVEFRKELQQDGLLPRNKSVNY